uniref:Carboxypeptidase n=1 Tax=Ananas comosus var. bracteatus TaxID=296719 RepID=A0A6V7PS27_ANACO|nr:unnamed protein product [Ananas comosus var. bracteatus]
MMITRDLGLLCLVAWLLAGKAASLAARRAERRDVAARQAEALDELIFDAANYRLRRRPQQNKYKQPYDVAAAAAAAAALHPQDGSKEGDKIAALPGQPQSNNSVDFDQYGGYVTVDAQHGRALFYYFAEAARSADPSSRPLLLWLNGGPGCSSIGFGAMEELGPFRVMSDGKTLYRNPFAWNKVANVLFLESPAGVGFSYSNTSDDYERSGDRRTAEDAYAFLVNWMERFPEYKGRDFFIAGESYAGHYVPQLAQTILHRNNASKDQAAGRENIATINLKGVMMGNAVINDETDTRGMYDYFWTHALISDEAIGAIHKSCNFSADSGDQSQRCLQALESIQLGNLDIYNIYAPLCLSPGIANSQHPKRPSVCTCTPIDTK